MAADGCRFRCILAFTTPQTLMPTIHADPVEIRLNDDGSIDEVIVTGAQVCIEQMDDDLWSMNVSGGSRCWLFQFTREGKAIVFNLVDIADI